MAMSLYPGAIISRRDGVSANHQWRWSACGRSRDANPICGVEQVVGRLDLETELFVRKASEGATIRAPGHRASHRATEARQLGG
jgi:hypothetical protein